MKPVVRVKAGDATGETARLRDQAAVDPLFEAYGGEGQGARHWTPALRSADADWFPRRDRSVARIRDLDQSNPWVSSGVDRQVDMLVGGTFRLNSKPSARLLGIDQDSADQLGQDIQDAWSAWAEDPIFRCDAERTLNFTGLMGLMAREFVGGEALAVLRWITKPGRDYATAVHVIDPDRLSNPNNTMDTATMRRGIELDEDGAPVAYHVRKAHPSDVFTYGADSWTWERFPRWDQIGTWQRPKVLHVFDKRRAGQTHGISRLVSNLVGQKMLSGYSQSELQAAVLNSSVVGAIYTQLGSEYAAEAIGTVDAATEWTKFNTKRADFYDKSRRVMDENRFITLFPSDRLDMNTQPRQTAGFPAFQEVFLRALAASLGTSYEQLSMDWSKTNYSSARAALNEVWRGIQRLRGLLIAGAANLVFAAFLEEALDRGFVTPPSGAADFYEAPAGYLRGDWIGPGRGYIDPVKEADAAIKRMGARLTTLERETAEQGGDWEQNLDQFGREEAAFAGRGLAGPLQGNAATADQKYPSDTDEKRGAE
ncbi:phage portal protein [Roseibium sediminicola]|uniref:Phage portal protein n=1 Tax=Roseibium sediminicola TaxID=2933272 RepID=A0ABT0H0R1_9HYPH|nr:phage portal protein [Roseibium sp. CAU 1639]MCK7615191.1 phage portal protein [Roseibium sp. CAU 1639]